MTAATQRRRALEKANEVRSSRAALKRRIAAGEISIEAVLADDDREISKVARSMAIEDLIGAVPGVGRSGVDAICEAFDLPRGAQLYGTTKQLRAEIADAIAALR